ncbi:hypothetical protein NDU88_008303 [Pleurodeles waltl]|uniref:Uncharacterized protein n=1 Tax=Pleurodeles waltl TaxID=8319 RepID=A0AAV7QPI1_PLEWA|nr:hypothetical protein NDU88_008303 [Pleurodeles waltl]
MQALGARQGAYRPASPHLRCPTCDSVLPELRPRDAAHNLSIRNPQPGVVRCPGALLLLLLLLTFPLMREVRVRPRSALHLCAGRRPRRTSSSGVSQSRVWRPVVAVPWGEESVRSLSNRSPQLWASSPDPSLRRLLVRANAMRSPTEPQFVVGGVGFRPGMAPFQAGGADSSLHRRHSLQWAAAVPSLKPPLLLGVPGGGEVSSCLG